MYSMTPIRDIMARREEENRQLELSFPPNYRSLLSQIRKNKGQSQETEKFSQAEEVLLK